MKTPSPIYVILFCFFCMFAACMYEAIDIHRLTEELREARNTNYGSSVRSEFDERQFIYGFRNFIYSHSDTEAVIRFDEIDTLSPELWSYTENSFLFKRRRVTYWQTELGTGISANGVVYNTSTTASTAGTATFATVQTCEIPSSGTYYGKFGATPGEAK